MTQPVQLYDAALKAERTLFLEYLLSNIDETNKRYAEMIIREFPECKVLFEEIKELIEYGNKLVQLKSLSADLRERVSMEINFQSNEEKEKRLKFLIHEQTELTNPTACQQLKNFLQKI